MNVQTFLLFLLILFSGPLLGQELPAVSHQSLEQLAEQTESEAVDDIVLQQLAAYASHPLNMNEATEEDLQQFSFLTPLQIQHFLRYRNALGNLLHVYELQAVPGWDVSTVRKLLPFIIVKQPLTIRHSILPRFRLGAHSVLMRTTRQWEKANGFTDSLPDSFGGDRNHYLLRYQYQYKNLLQFGLTADKDAGERFFGGAQRAGFDFYSAHLLLRKTGVVETLVLGDFTVNMGQGLIQWQSLAFNKNADVLAVKRQSPVLRPYASAGEFHFHRGAGITLQKGKTEATFFASLRKIDANLNSDTSDTEKISSFLTTGLHRTAKENASKNNTDQTSFGTSFNYKNRNFRAGWNAIGYRFSRPVQKRNEPYNAFAWRGNAWANSSVHYSYTYKNLHFFGEAALDKNLEKAWLNGALLSVDAKVDVSVLHRMIGKKYQAVYGRAFTESATPANERGTYIGLRIRPVRQILINAYSDFYRFPWLKFRVDAPSGGSEYFVQVNYLPNKAVELYSRYRAEKKYINERNDAAPVNSVVLKARQNWRLHGSYQLSPQLVVRSRADIIWYDRRGVKAEEGFLFFTEADYQLSRRLAADGRILFFETNGYNSRLYAYEHDVLYAYSIPAFFDKGMRYYVNLRCKINQHWSCWGRWAQTIYRDKDKIGSGLDAIAGNKKTEFRLQLLYNSR